MSTRIVTTLPHNEFPVAVGNFDTSRESIDHVILHSMDGTKEGTRQWFNNPASKVSAHYGVNMDGSLDHFLEENYTAYQAGNYAMNQRSIGIEHEDLGNSGITRSDALYETSAKLLADICKFYSIPCDSSHVLPHRSVVQTACPGGLDIDRIIKKAQEILGVQTPPIAPLPPTPTIKPGDPGTPEYDQQQALNILGGFVQVNGGNLEGAAILLTRDAYPVYKRYTQEQAQVSNIENVVTNTTVQNSSLSTESKLNVVQSLRDYLAKVTGMLLGGSHA